MLFEILELKGNDGKQWVDFEHVLELLVKSHNNDQTTRTIKFWTKNWNNTTKPYGIELCRAYLPPDDDAETRQYLTEMFDKANENPTPWIQVCLTLCF